MKILILLDEPWDSGITSYALQVAELLQQDRQTVVVGARAGKAPARQAAERGLTVAPYESGLQILRLLRRQRWDVVNVHSGRPHTWAILNGLLGAGGPVIRTRGDAREVRTDLLTRFVYRRTRAVIAASEHIRRQYEELLGIPDEKLKTIYPGVTVDAEIQPPPEDRVGIVGRLDPVKGHATLLEAAVRVLEKRPKTKFLIAGKEANVSRRLLLNQAEALRLPAASVEFLGHVPSALEFMRGCTLGVIASIGSEEISRACLEWMSVGRPVVGTLVGCLPELIEPDETGFLTAPGDSAMLAENILRVLGDPLLARALGKNAHMLVRTQMSPGRQLERTLDVFRAAGSPGAAAAGA